MNLNSKSQTSHAGLFLGQSSSAGAFAFDGGQLLQSGRLCLVFVLWNSCQEGLHHVLSICDVCSGNYVIHCGRGGREEGREGGRREGEGRFRADHVVLNGQAVYLIC